MAETLPDDNEDNEGAMIRFNVNPVPKPRMTQSDRWNKRPTVLRYWQFKDELQRQANEVGFRLSDAFNVTFYLPMPQSWSKAKKLQMMNKPHRQTPDLDNLEKAVGDSLLPDNDSGIWFKQSQKFWGLEGCILIENIREAESK